MNYLSESFLEDIYNTLQGVLVQDARVPGVESLFVEGSPCDIAYGELHEAYQRLLLRLSKQDDDPDVEIIIGALLTISRYLSTAMYQCGAKFALQALRSSSESARQDYAV